MFFGPPNIDKMKNRLDLRGLMRALQYKDPETRRKAAKALGLLCDPQWRSRGLGFSQVVSVRDVLMAKVKDKREQTEVRAAAIKALVRIAHTNAVELILEIENNSSEPTELKKAAAQGVEQFVTFLVGELNTYYADNRPSPVYCLKKIGLRAMEQLIGILKNRDRWRGLMQRNILVNCAEILGDIGDPRAVGALIDTAFNGPLIFEGSVELTVREAAVKAFEKIGGEEAKKAVQRYREDADNRDKLTKDPKEQIIHILALQIPPEQKRDGIIAILRKSDPRSELGRKVIYCSCGYPTMYDYRDGSCGPIYKLLKFRQGGEYYCPSCGSFVYSEQF